MADQIKGSKLGTPIGRAPTPITEYDNNVDGKMQEQVDQFRPTYTKGTDAKPQDFSKVENCKAVGQPFNPCRS